MPMYLPGFRKRQEAARKKGKYIGIGFGLGVELSGVASELLVPMENQPGYGAATVRLDPRGKVQVFEGRVDGVLVWPPRGTHGFGYDPIFRPDGERLTFGEMDPEKKHAMSHRARAFAQLVRAVFEDGR